MDITHAVVEADISMQIGTGSVQRKTEILMITTDPSQSIIIGNNHSPFACRHVFISKKTETSNRRKRPSTLATKSRSMGFGSVLHKEDSFGRTNCF